MPRSPPTSTHPRSSPPCRMGFAILRSPTKAGAPSSPHAMCCSAFDWPPLSPPTSGPTETPATLPLRSAPPSNGSSPSEPAPDSGAIGRRPTKYVTSWKGSASRSPIHPMGRYGLFDSSRRCWPVLRTSIILTTVTVATDLPLDHPGLEGEETRPGSWRSIGYPSIEPETALDATRSLPDSVTRVGWKRSRPFPPRLLCASPLRPPRVQALPLLTALGASAGWKADERKRPSQRHGRPVRSVSTQQPAGVCEPTPSWPGDLSETRHRLTDGIRVGHLLFAADTNAM